MRIRETVKRNLIGRPLEVISLTLPNEKYPIKNYQNLLHQ